MARKYRQSVAEYRVEHDSMGEVRVPAGARWGAQTQRAVENFPISGLPLPPALVRALALVKAEAARVNKVAPAIAVGAPLVLKPAPKTPLSALLLAEIVAERHGGTGVPMLERARAAGPAAPATVGAA